MRDQRPGFVEREDSWFQDLVCASRGRRIRHDEATQTEEDHQFVTVARRWIVGGDPIDRSRNPIDFFVTFAPSRRFEVFPWID